MPNTKKKVLIITNYVAPYCVDLYNLINEKADLTVCYGVKNDLTRNKDYKNNNNMKYNAIFRKNIRIGTRSDLSFEIFKIIKKGNLIV